MSMEGIKVIMMMMWALILWMQGCFAADIRLGVIQSTETSLGYEVREVVTQFNAMRLHKTSIQPFIAWISLNDTFLSLKSGCDVLEKGVHGVIDAGLGLQDSIGSLFSYYGIPVLKISDQVPWSHEETEFGPPSVNLHPDSRQLHKALLETVKYLELESIIILYYRDIDLLLWKDFVEERRRSRLHLPLFYHLALGNKDLRSTLTTLKAISFNSLLYLQNDRNHTLHFLEECLSLGLLGPERQLILSSLDLDEALLKPYSHSGANLTSMSLSEGDLEGSTVSRALMDDAFTLLLKAFEVDANELLNSSPRGLSCQSDNVWNKGEDLLEKIRDVEFMGKSGLVRINKHGRRDSFALDIRTISPVSSYDPPKGYWTTDRGLMWKDSEEKAKDSSDLFQSRTLRVSTLRNSPYVMEKLGYQASRDSSESVNENPLDRYEGFVIDLLKELSSLLHFNYSIAFSDTYGSMDKSGKWNGMIRDLLDEEADMAIADLTINYQREQVVDFTMPFLDLGISLVYVNAPEKSINLFAFLSPLSMNVWILMILSGGLVSLTMYFIGRYSPLETEDLDSPEGTSPFKSLHHCLWFTVASWVQQGCDFLPRAVSGRFVASIWWFFTLIMISSYTANLAAFLTIERMESPINTARDLASQSKIRYGAVASGSTASFFESSTDEIYEKMWRFMSRHSDEVMMASNDAGLEKVISENGGYAFFMESVSIEYHAERNCRLQQIGGLLDSKSYGIALPQGSPLRSTLSSALIKLNENGIIRDLKKKWWKEQRGGGSCVKEDTTGSVSELNLENVGGIFMVLIVGLALGSIIAFIEHYVKVLQDKKKLTTL